MKTYRAIIYVAFLCTLTVMGKISVEVIPGSSQLSVKEAMEVTVAVSSDEQLGTAGKPSFEPSENFSIKFYGGPNVSHSSQMYSMNGRMVSSTEYSYIYTYLFSPKKEGKLYLPRATVKVDGNEYTSDSAVVYVTKAAPAGENTVGITFTPAEITSIIGEKTDCWISITVPASSDLRDFSINFEPEEYGFSLEGSDEQFRQETVVGGNGAKMTRLTCHLCITPFKAGTFELPGPSVTALVPDLTQRPDFFGSYPAKRQYLTADPVKMEVSALPEEGKPADFTGLLGRHIAMTVTADSQEVAVGDPIVLTIRLTGAQCLGSMEIPSLKNQPGFVDDFRLSSEENGINEENAMVFHRTLRVLKDSVAEIPVVRIPYYDLNKKEYTFVESSPIPLKVAKSASVTLGDALRGGEGDMKSSSSEEEVNQEGQKVTSRLEGVNDIYDADELMEKTNSARILLKNELKTSRGRWGLLIFPPALLLLFVMAGLLRSSPMARERRKRKQAIPDFVSKTNRLRGKSTNGIEEFSRYFQDMLRIFYGLSSGVVTYSDVECILTDFSVEEKMRLRQIFAFFEAARYGGAQDGKALESMIDEAQAIAKRMAR